MDANQNAMAGRRNAQGTILASIRQFFCYWPMANGNHYKPPKLNSMLEENGI